jgi:hypothetical protein
MVGLAFTGLPAGTLSLFAALSHFAIGAVLALMTLAVLWFGWRVGSGVPRSA